MMRSPTPRGRGAVGLLLAATLLLPVAAAAAPAAADPHGVELARLTSPELVQRIARGGNIVIVPIGGTEQSGAAIVLGKHNARVQALAVRIAEALGNALVAPVIAYVPEGSIDPPSGHLRYPGTISVSVAAFEGSLEGAAASLAHAGFRDIVLIGDHGGYQQSLVRVADRLNAAWKRKPPPGATGPRVHALTEYYDAASRGFAAALARQGYPKAEIGEHAGLADASLSLALDPQGVRTVRGADGRPQVAGTPDRDGIQGDPRRATDALGEAGVKLIVDASVQAIRERVRR